MIWNNISHQNIHCSSCCDDDLEGVTVEVPVEREPAAAVEDPLHDGEDKCRYLSYFVLLHFKIRVIDIINN